MLSGTPAGRGRRRRDAWTLPVGLRLAIERANNESQVEATKTALNRDPVVLIQGPPGTGRRAHLSLLGVVARRPAVTKTDIDFKHYAKARVAPGDDGEEKRDREPRRAPDERCDESSRRAAVEPPPPSPAGGARHWPRVLGTKATSVQRFSYARLEQR